jgi:hypothetical protein
MEVTHTLPARRDGTSALATAAASMVPQSLQELQAFAGLLSKSAIVPKAYQGKPADVMVAILYGLEIGLKPLQALQGIAVVNGKPSVYGDAALAVVRASPLCEYVRETFSPETMTALCYVKRQGEEEQVRMFSEANARKARLWGKSGPWTDYPQRMLQMRARSWALRDVFPDVLQGLWLREEAMDIPAEAVADRAPAPRQEAQEAVWEPATPPAALPPAQAEAEADDDQPPAASPEQYDRLAEILAADVWTSEERTKKMANLRRMTEPQAERYLANVEASTEQRLRESTAELEEGPPEPAERSFGLISERQVTRLWAIAKSEGGFTDDGVHRLLYSEYGLASASDVPRDLYDEICARLMKTEEAQRWNRDPHTPDMFGQPAPGFEDDSSLPF